MLVLGLILVIGPAPATAAWEDFDGGFETGDFSQYLEVQAVPERATIVKSPVAEGTYAARFERRVGDELSAGSSRSEAVPAPEFHAGETRYFRHLLYLPFESIDWKHFLILCQWHDSSGDPPPLSLQAFESSGVKKLLIGSGTQKSIYYEFEIPGSAEWFELVYRITFGVKGSIEVWLNGKSLGEVAEINTLGTEPTNWKLGNYRSKEAEGTTVVYQDGVMITDSFFSHPPTDVIPPPTKDAPVENVTGPPAPSSGSNSQAPAINPESPSCQLARSNLGKARVRLRAVKKRPADTRSRGSRQKRAQQIARTEKRYRQAKKRVRQACE